MSRLFSNSSIAAPRSTLEATQLLTSLCRLQPRGLSLAGNPSVQPLRQRSGSGFCHRASAPPSPHRDGATLGAAGRAAPRRGRPGECGGRPGGGGRSSERFGSLGQRFQAWSKLAPLPLALQLVFSSFPKPRQRGLKKARRALLHPSHHRYVHSRALGCTCKS